MKKLTILLYFIINIGVVFSQTNINSISFYIDKDTISYYLSEIDSISHYENQAVNVWSNNICYKNLVNEIDSICFEYKEKHTYYQIPKESLEGWEEGCMDSNGCFIVCRKEMSDGGYFCFIGEKGREDRGIALKFDKDMNIQTIFSNQGLLNVFADERTNQQYGLFTTSDSAYIKELDGVKNIKPLNAVTRVPNGEVLNIICRWINNAFEINDILTLFSNGSEYLPGFLLSQGLTAGIWGYSQPVALGINLLLGWLEHNYEENYNNLLYDYIGGPMIWISDIDNNNAPQYKIQVNIEGLNTLGKPITCSIHTGVAIRRNESNVNYDNCDFRLKEHEIKFDESYLTNLNAEPKIYYWLRPYAVVKVDGVTEQFVLRRQKYLWGGPQEPIITYGDVDKIYYDIQPKVITGETLSVTKETATIVCSFSHVPNGATCGVQYGNDGNYNITGTSSSDGERTINLSGLKPGTTYKYRAFIQYEGENYYGETKSFTTKKENPTPDPDPDPEPIVTTGGYYDVTEKSAVVEGSFENVPEGGKCYVFLQWEEGDEYKMITYDSSEGKNKKISCSGLKPATTYYYTAAISSDGKEYLGEEKSFTTKKKEEPEPNPDPNPDPIPTIPDLTGTWTFNQTYLGAETVTMDLKLKEIGNGYAIYTAGGFYGVITCECTVSSNRSVSISLIALYGARGTFSGTLNENFTSVSGDSYLYVSNSWALPPFTVNDSWTFSR